MIGNLNMDYGEKMQRCHEYVETLEEERRKIQVFQRELPLCLELVTQAIEACRKELSGTSTEIVGRSDCTEQTMSECGPVFEEFMPMKKSTSSGEDYEEESQKPEESEKISENNTDKKKSDWLRSVQLWNQSPDPPEKDHVPKRVTVVEVKKNVGAFQPFNKEKPATKISQQLTPASKPSGSLIADSNSTAGSGSGKREPEKDRSQNQTLRKNRRCWSPELHRRFLHALQQLGGSHAATPKQIRDLMKVDGLTNDEVKSHLQKYRLHTRRPSPNIPNSNTQQQPQFVVVGGIWVPPPQPPQPPPAAISSTSPPSSSGDATTAGIYAPVAATPLNYSTSSKNCSESKKSNSEGQRNSRCNSPSTTSSSIHTTSGSPVS